MSHDANNLRRDATELARNTSGGWVRTASSSPAAPVPQQLALVTGIGASGTSPHYSGPYDLTFHLPTDVAHFVEVDVVLLKSASGVGYDVDNPDGATLEQLLMVAVDVRREGSPRIGDVVRIWRSDGVALGIAEGGWDSEAGAWINDYGVFTDALQPTDYLRGLDTFDEGTPQIPFHDADDSEIVWIDATDLGAEGPPGPTGPAGPPGADADIVTEGYAIDVSGVGSGTVVVGFDPTEMTGWSAAAATTFQIFQHLGTGATPTDPAWLTVSNYAAATNQMWWKGSGGFDFKTTASYSTNATTNPIQFLINIGGTWDWKTGSGYDATKTQLFGQVSGTLTYHTLKDWLNSHLTITLTLGSTDLTVELVCDGTTISTASVSVSDC